MLPKSVNILNVTIDSTSYDKVLRLVRFSLDKKEKFFIVTPNPEQLIIAQSDKEYRNVLNSATVRIADGVGLVAANKFLNLPTTHNPLLRPVLYFAQGLGVGFNIIFDREWLTAEMEVVRGRQVFLKLIELANKMHWHIVLLGDNKNSAQKARSILEKNYLGVKLTAFEGPLLDDGGFPVSSKETAKENNLIKKINQLSPELVFVGFRAPAQEKWLYRWYDKLKIGGAMVVGGTFDYISGKKPLPPDWVADAGLEWLWRLIKGDQTVKRVFNAYPRFAFKIFLKKLVSKG